MPLTGSGNGPAGLSPSPGGAAAGVTSRRTLGRKAQAPRVPTKAQQAVDKLLDKIRTNADQTPSAAKKKTERGEEKRDANGRFAKRTRPGPGRPPGSRNKISKAFKEVLRDLGEGIDVTFKDPATDTLVEGPVAHLLAQPLVAGLTDPKHYAAFVKMILEYDISQQKTQSEVGPEHRRQTPKMVFLNVVPAPRKSVPGDTGLGEGEDRLELAEDPPSLCLACSGSRPAAHRIWSPHRAVRWVCRLRPTSMIDDVSPCGPVCPSGPITLLPSITRPIHSSGREIERCEVCNGVGPLTASLHSSTNPPLSSVIFCGEVKARRAGKECRPNSRCRS